MTSIAIVGDGPGGLSAALFLAKNGQDVAVYGDDQTGMRFALLHNYLGVPAVPGSEFQDRAIAQVQAAGATIVRSRVGHITVAGDGFELDLNDGTKAQSDYVILAEGRSPELGLQLGLELHPGGGIAVDTEFRSSQSRVYVLGRSIRPRRSQAIISAGAGATAALDILSDITGADFQDWDSPPKAD